MTLAKLAGLVCRFHRACVFVHAHLDDSVEDFAVFSDKLDTHLSRDRDGAARLDHFQRGLILDAHLVLMAPR